MSEREEVRLTALARSGGLGGKVASGELAQLLAELPIPCDPNLLVDSTASDDAAVYQIGSELAIVFSADYFPPMVDDPYVYGQIAVADALSDVYAMGATPALALNLASFPTGRLDLAVFRDILRGGVDKADEAGVLIAGGHSLRDEEPKYGLAVIGFAHPERVIRNGGARPGDRLILSKPLGVGTITTAAREGHIPEATPQNRAALEERVQWQGDVDPVLQNMLLEPQISGGLLFAVPADQAGGLAAGLRQAGVAAAEIREITKETRGTVRVLP